MSIKVSDLSYKQLETACKIIMEDIRGSWYCFDIETYYSKLDLLEEFNVYLGNKDISRVIDYQRSKKDYFYDSDAIIQLDGIKYDLSDSKTKTDEDWEYFHELDIYYRKYDSKILPEEIMNQIKYRLDFYNYTTDRIIGLLDEVQIITVCQLICERLKGGWGNFHTEKIHLLEEFNRYVNNSEISAVLSGYERYGAIYGDDESTKNEMYSNEWVSIELDYHEDMEYILPEKICEYLQQYYIIDY